MSTFKGIANWAWVVLGVALVVFVIFTFIQLRVGTIRSMRDTARFLTQHKSESELVAKYRPSRSVYYDHADMPKTFQRGLHPDTNVEFHVYTREGMPYWYFVAVLDRKSRIIEYGVATNY
jgi:hypothetical protein